MDTVKQLYRNSITQLEIEASYMQNMTKAYISRISTRSSTLTIKGATSNLTTNYRNKRISWNRLMTFFRIIGGSYITVSLVTNDTIVTASDDIYVPVITNRLTTGTYHDGEILMCLTNMFGVPDKELEKRILTNVRNNHTCIDPKILAGKASNLYTALTATRMSWDMFITKLYMMGILTSTVYVTVQLRDIVLKINADIRLHK